MYINNHCSSLTLSSVACGVENCDVCTDAVNTCDNCAGGFDLEDVCTGEESLMLGT